MLHSNSIKKISLKKTRKIILILIKIYAFPRHLDIRDAVLSLVRVLQDQMDKLERHEGRERQLGEQLTRSLATLEKRTRGEEKNIENIAAYLGRVEEKVKFIQGTVEKVNSFLGSFNYQLVH